MSVTEQSGGPGAAFGAERWDGGYDAGFGSSYAPSSAGSGGDGMDRMPPQDRDAEQSVLGPMLLPKDAITDVM